jgi:hypothetical protein
MKSTLFSIKSYWLEVIYEYNTFKASLATQLMEKILWTWDDLLALCILSFTQNHFPNLWATNESTCSFLPTSSFTCSWPKFILYSMMRSLRSFTKCHKAPMTSLLSHRLNNSFYLVVTQNLSTHLEVCNYVGYITSSHQPMHILDRDSKNDQLQVQTPSVVDLSNWPFNQLITYAFALTTHYTKKILQWFLTSFHPRSF